MAKTTQDEMNRFEVKLEELKTRSMLTVSLLNRARTVTQKVVLYKEALAISGILRSFNDFEKIAFYKWFLEPCECDSGFVVFDLEKIEEDMQTALEVSNFSSLIGDEKLPYRKVVDKPLDQLLSCVDFYLKNPEDTPEYIKFDSELVVIEFLNLFVDCGEYECICDECQKGSHCKGTECFCRIQEGKCLILKEKKDGSHEHEIVCDHTIEHDH